MRLSVIVLGLSLVSLLHTITIIIVIMTIAKHQDNHRREP